MFLRRKNSLFWIAVAVVSLSLSGCSEERPGGSYVVDGRVVSETDGTVWLYQMLPEYGQLTKADSVEMKRGKFRFAGSVVEPMEAFVRIEGDSLAYPFVLSNNHLTIHVGVPGDYSVFGSASNARLSSLLEKRGKMRESRRAIQSEYMRLAADSALNRMMEDSLAVRYRTLRADFGEEVVRTVSANAAAYPLMGRTALRLFDDCLTQAQADSLAALVAR